MKTLSFDEQQHAVLAVKSLWSSFRYVGKENLLALGATWRLLEKEAHSPIEQLDWAVASAECTNASQIEIIGVMHDGELTAVVPLAIKRIAGVKRRLMLGVDEYLEPMDFLFADAESLDRLVQALAIDSRPMFLMRLPSESGSLDALRSVLKKRSLTIERPGRSFPFIPLDASWSEPERHLKSGRRSDLRRMRRHLESEGQAATSILVPTPAQLDALLEEACQVEACSWKGAAGSAMLYDDRQQAHLRKYLHLAARLDKVRIGFLRLNGQAIAMEIGVVQADALWLLKIGYDATFAHCAPGQLLLRDMIEYAAKAGLKSFEFLGANEPWIDIWSSHQRPCVSVRIYPFSLDGGLALASDAASHLMEVAKREAEKLRAPVRQCVMPVFRLAARSYIAGDKLADALRIADKLQAKGMSATLGYWNSEFHKPSEIAQEGLAGFERLASYSDKNYLSVKLPPLKFDKELISQLADAAVKVNRRIHFDAHGIECVLRQRKTCEDLQQHHPNLDIGFTLPGRWERSLEDADWVCQQRYFVRVVKGQWAAPGKAGVDPAVGFLNVIDRLAGRARMVAVATHDPRLAANALHRLQAAGTPCELELLYGLPARGCLQVARQLGVPVRFYVPYGEAYLPYSLSKIRGNPRIIWWTLRDSVTAIWRGTERIS